jgi:Zn-dependent protease with chaperone function
MRHLLRPFAAGALSLVIALAPVLAEQQPTQQSAPPQQTNPTATPCQQTQQQGTSQQSTQQQSQPTQGSQPNSAGQPTQGSPPNTPGQTTQTPPAPNPCPPAQTNLHPGDPGYAPPITQQENPNVKQGSKADVESIGNRNVSKGVIPNLISLEKEIAMGKYYSQEVERTAKLVDDPVITEYVNRVGQNLVRNSDAKVPFTIKVIDSDEVNAFALPGGFFYVFTGLIMRAQEESELAGVMAHEIAHVAARHGTRRMSQQELLQIALIPAMIFLPGGWAGYGIYEAMVNVIPLGMLKFSRDDEREADYLGLEYMYKAGYDPNSYITFFERLRQDEKRSPGSIPKVFSDHPPTDERIEKAQHEISTILPARENYIVTTSEFDTVKARLFAYERRNRLINGKDNGGPTLRTKTEQKKDPNASQTNPQNGGDDSDRPVLKKRPDGTGNNN